MKTRWTVHFALLCLSACGEEFTAFEERCVDRYFEVGPVCEDFEPETCELPNRHPDSPPDALRCRCTAPGRFRCEPLACPTGSLRGACEDEALVCGELESPPSRGVCLDGAWEECSECTDTPVEGSPCCVDIPCGSFRCEGGRWTEV